MLLQRGGFCLILACFLNMVSHKWRVVCGSEVGCGCVFCVYRIIAAGRLHIQRLLWD